MPLGSRALDILSFLASHPGELKTNNEIVKQVWPNTFVDEANLRVHLSALRKALGDTQRSPRFLSNVPGRGYAFIAPLERDNQAASPRVAPLANSHSGRFPARIFGREESIAGIAGQLTKERLVTICGPGGIGKSTVAKAVLSRCAADLNAIWIDLSEVGNGVLIPTVVASELGILIRTDNILKDINAHLDGRNVVVVLTVVSTLWSTPPNLRKRCWIRQHPREYSQRAASLSAHAANASTACSLWVFLRLPPPPRPL